MYEREEVMTRDRISVCVCTFRRPESLGRLLESLARQVVGHTFCFDVIVVDNDKSRSAEGVVRSFAERTGMATFYDCEPERNISLTRNRAVLNATGNLVAFIDDDEYPAEEWLVQLYRTLKRQGADGVLGPVLPDFPPDAPRWLRKGRFFDRRRLPTGAYIADGDGRTGNVLLLRSIFTEGGCWFDPAFGRTGGEDSDFFQRQFRSGGKFVWCDEAAVYENVPPERWKVSFLLKRLLRAGTGDGELMRARKLPSRGMVARNFAILCACAVLTPPSLFLPKHDWMRLLQKGAYCSGVITAYFGLSILRYRD